MKRSIVLLYILLVCTIYSVAQAKIETALDTAKILIGGRASLKVSVEVPEKVYPVFPKIKIQQDLTPGIEVLSIKYDTVNNGSNKRYNATYMLTAWEKNTYKIPSLVITVAGKKLKTKDFLLTVNEILINKKQAQPKPSDPVVEVPFAWFDLIPAFLFLLISVIGFVIGYTLYKRIILNKRLSLPKKKVISLSPYEEALKELDELRQKVSVITNQKIYYTKIIDIIKMYIHKRFYINALEMTSGEILKVLKVQADTAELEELSNLFSTADLVKFAKYSTSETDKEYYLSNVIRFIEDTKIVTEKTNIEINTEKELEDVKLKGRSKIVVKSIAIGIVVLSIALFIYACYELYTVVI